MSDQGEGRPLVAWFAKNSATAERQSSAINEECDMYMNFVSLLA